MPDNPTITAVIPTHNRVASLPSAIDSVLGQILPVEELIVVDDGSDDGTAEMLTRRYAQETRLRVLQQANRGVSAARNLAIRQARGDWIALLDSDDRWYPGKLERQFAALTRAEDHDGEVFRFCHCDENWTRNGRFVNPKTRHRKPGGDVFAASLALCAISPSAAVIATSLLDETGLFDETLPACEDYDLWLRIAARERVLYVDEKLLEKTGGHADQLSRRYPAMDLFRLRAQAKLLLSGILDTSQTTLTRASFRERFVIYARGALRRGRSDEVSDLLTEWEYCLGNAREQVRAELEAFDASLNASRTDLRAGAGTHRNN
ncbi:MAG: glycosyl transferase [Gammaproteobacteria bacterium]|nr:MAG: glycosyl transferase [Gammaproteobacteria bacterium]